MLLQIKTSCSLQQGYRDGRAIAQAVNGQLLNSKPRFRAQGSPEWFVVDKLTLGRLYLRVLRFPLSVSFHRCSVFTHVSSGGWTKGPLEAQFHRDTVSPHRNSKKRGFFRNGVLCYKQLIRPIMDYACPIWRSADRSHVRKLQVLQSECLRIANNAPWYISDSEVYEDLGFPACS
jgi:hypothetical protein